jgi:oxygen-independent coproporphyrinogen-3 oxidase
LQAINESLPLANDCEFTFETRTFQFTQEKIETCLENGINRFSLGVQSFDTRARQSIGRVDDGETIARKIEQLRSYNSAAVSIDLMYGLPYQSERDFMDDIIQADRLGVDGMALYQLNVFDKGKLDEKIRSGKITKPATTSQQAVYHIKSYKLMNSLGYMQPSVAHWTKGTRDRSLYNRLSKEGHIMHAFGAGAGGRTLKYGYFTHVALEPYIKMISAGMKPIMGMSSSSENRNLYNLITSQIDSGFLRFDVVNREAGTDLYSLFEPLIESWSERGMVEVDSNIMKLTPEGQFWYVNIAQAMVDVLGMAENSEYKPEVAQVAAQN